MLQPFWATSMAFKLRKCQNLSLTPWSRNWMVFKKSRSLKLMICFEWGGGVKNWLPRSYWGITWSGLVLHETQSWGVSKEWGYELKNHPVSVGRRSSMSRLSSTFNRDVNNSRQYVSSTIKFNKQTMLPLGCWKKEYLCFQNYMETYLEGEKET